MADIQKVVLSVCQAAPVHVQAMLSRVPHAIYWCSAIAGLQVHLFRRIRDDLIKNHMEGPEGVPGAPRRVDLGWLRHHHANADQMRFARSGAAAIQHLGRRSLKRLTLLRMKLQV